MVASGERASCQGNALPAILLDVTNPGLWTAHCQIAEHHETGMMSSFNVVPSDGD